MLNLIKEQDYHVIDKIYLYARNLNEPNYQFLIKKCEDAGIKHLNNPNTFIKCSDTMEMFMRILMITTQIEIKKVLIVFDDMIADIMGNKKFQAIIKELFIRCRKLNISLVFITFIFISIISS